MKFSNVNQFYDFQKVLDQCIGNVYLKSNYGDAYNLKSKLSQFVAFAALLGEHGNELELFADLREDEALLLNFLNQHNEIL